MNQLQGAADAALKHVREGKGAVHGTHVHTDFKTQVDSLGNTDLHTEISYKDYQIVPYLTKGSVHPDVVERPIQVPHAAHDLKTGKAKVTKKQIQKIKQPIPIVQKVEEIKPRYKE